MDAANKHYTRGTNPYTDQISIGIATYQPSFPDRWNNWRYEINKANIGGNPYEDLRAALSKLGINANNSNGYQDKFGITLHSHTPVAIGGDQNHQLIASLVAREVSTTDVGQDLVSQAARELNLTEGQYTMFYAPAPPATTEYVSPTIMLVNKEASVRIASNVAHILGVCGMMDSSRNIQYFFSPITGMEAYFALDDNKLGSSLINPEDAEVSIIVQPKHGHIEQSDKWMNGEYVPDNNYEGNDSFIVRITVGDNQLEIHYFITVAYQNTSTTDVNKECKGAYWKIALSNDAGNAPVRALLNYAVMSEIKAVNASDGTALASTAFTPDTPFQPASPSTYLANVTLNLPNADIGISNLGGAAVLLADPDLISADSANGPMLSALAGGWYWKTNSINALADKLTWNYPVPQADKTEFESISSKVGAADHNKRWIDYQHNARYAIVGGNPFENMRAAMASLGLSTEGAKRYEDKFGITLKPSLTTIQGGRSPASCVDRCIGQRHRTTPVNFN